MVLENNHDNNEKLIGATIQKLPAYLLPLVVVNIVFCAAIWFIVTSPSCAEYSDVRIGIILFVLFAVTVIITVCLYKLEISRSIQSSSIDIVDDKGTIKIVCPFWDDFVRQEEPQIEISDDGIASIDGYRAYRFLDHIFKHQKCTTFYALDLAFYRWYEVVEKDSVFNISGSLLDSIGEMCRQKNCREFKRILCVTEKELFDQQYSSVDVLNKIKGEEEKLTDQYPISMETVVCVFGNNNEHKKHEINFANHRTKELVGDLHDFALFTGEVDVAIVETGLSSPDAVIPLAKSRFELIKNKEKITKMKYGFLEILTNSYPIKTIIEVLEIVDSKGEKNA